VPDAAGFVTVRAFLASRWSDLLLAICLAALVLAEVAVDPLLPYAASVPLGLVQAGAVAFRRRAPLAALVAAAAALFVQTAAGVSLHTPVSPIVIGLVTVYSAAQYEPLPRAAVGLLAAVCVSFGAIQLAIANGESYGWSDRLFIAVFIVAPWLGGRALHGRTLEADELAERARRLEREREQAVDDERGRIARELHDVIAHSLSVIVVQAGAAERVSTRRPEQAEETLRAIQQIGRQALAEMGRLVGVLRTGGEEVGLAPQPGLGQLDPLLDETRRAGLPVELHVEGDPQPLPPGLDLSAYRIVQEALTNARKHAGDARAQLTIRYHPSCVEIEIADDGEGAASDLGGGHGLIGMRERAAVFGGTLHAGPRPEGGFTVQATLPLPGAPA
jgi:signal transduction histidine kinase